MELEESKGQAESQRLREGAFKGDVKFWITKH